MVETASRSRWLSSWDFISPISSKDSLTSDSFLIAADDLKFSHEICYLVTRMLRFFLVSLDARFVLSLFLQVSNVSESWEVELIYGFPLKAYGHQFKLSKMSRCCNYYASWDVTDVARTRITWYKTSVRIRVLKYNKCVTCLLVCWYDNQSKV